MSFQALDYENNNILLKFDWLKELKTEIIKRHLDKKLISLKVNQKNEEQIEQELNYYQFVFDLSLPEKIQSEVDEITTSKNKPEIRSDFEPKPLLTTDQVFNETAKKIRNLLGWKSDIKK